ncbi:MAG: hypothetical protein HKN03_14385 [Acidimicrobiales bacterium]|nr:hypothetical protein [Acidimicrobiales bacterium]
MSFDSHSFKQHDLLASLPDLRDEPLDAPWLRRGRSASDMTGVIDRVPQTIPAVPEVNPTTDDAPTPKVKKRRRWPRVLLGLTLLLALAVGGTGLYVKRQFDGIERVAVRPLLAAPSPGGTNYLIVGTDSRENLDPNIENAAAIFGDGSVDFGGQRTDTIQILRINDDGTQHVLALPRDLYVPIGGGERNRINAAFAFGGAELLIQTIEGSLGIPIHHYAEVDMAGFIDLVDAVGGVTIEFPYPAYDLKTGLNVPAGPVELNSAQALSYVRSRTYTEVIDGQNVVDPRGDLGRVKRQQAFLQALAAELESPRNGLSLLTNLETPLGSFRIDDSMSFTEAASLANKLRGLDLNDEWDLVVSHYTTPTGAQVLALDSEASQPSLSFFSR